MWLRLIEPSSFLSSGTCWITGAGASYDCLGRERPCVPLTRNLMSTTLLDPPDALLSALQSLHELGVVEYATLEEGIGPRIELTIDQLRRATTSDSQSISIKANDCLKALTEAIAAAIATAQFPAFTGSGFWERGDDSDVGYRAWNYCWPWRVPTSQSGRFLRSTTTCCSTGAFGSSDNSA